MLKCPNSVYYQMVVSQMRTDTGGFVLGNCVHVVKKALSNMSEVRQLERGFYLVIVRNVK